MGHTKASQLCTQFCAKMTTCDNAFALYDKRLCNTCNTYLHILLTGYYVLLLKYFVLKGAVNNNNNSLPYFGVPETLLLSACDT